MLHNEENLPWLSVRKTLRGRLERDVLRVPWDRIQLRRMSISVGRLSAGVDAMELGWEDTSAWDRQLQECIQYPVEDNFGRSQPPPECKLMLEEKALVVSFDEGVRSRLSQLVSGIKSKDTAYAAIAWKLPEWYPMGVAMGLNEKREIPVSTVNEGAFAGALTALELGWQYATEELPFRAVFGDSELIVDILIGRRRAVKPEMEQWRDRVMGAWEQVGTEVGLFHIHREYNGAADFLVNQVLDIGSPCGVILDGELKGKLREKNAIPEWLAAQPVNSKGRLQCWENSSIPRTILEVGAQVRAIRSGSGRNFQVDPQSADGAQGIIPRYRSERENDSDGVEGGIEETKESEPTVDEADQAEDMGEPPSEGHLLEIGVREWVEKQ